ncbi:MFS transporter [Salininema proteolyticum]|uniref:MFS transporter n=1 Tax=Salininema proteolyticum TaxID=1607685 RepID=A0ABV8U4A8_9ACTN
MSTAERTPQERTGPAEGQRQGGGTRPAPSEGRGVRQPARPAKGRWIADWDPDDRARWEAGGRSVARRNLAWSVLAEHVGFSVWVMFSIVVPYLAAAGYGFSTAQLFWLVALPNLVGSILRLPYTTAVARFGGRNWTVFSALVLLLPTGMLVWCLSSPDTPFGAFALTAALAGLGGGNFASSMANISYFYPERLRGTALGVNAAGGNIGVSSVQLTGPFLIGLGVLGAGSLTDEGRVWLYNVPVFWGLLALVAAAGAWWGMDNLSVAKARLSDQLPALKEKHTWVMALVYVGTFGSFIGYSFAFPLVARLEFPQFASLWLAALGPLLGSLTRPAGGWLADKYAGAPITGTCFAVMGGSALLALWSVSAGSFAAFFAAFMVLFCASGIANGSAYRSIPAIFTASLTGRDPATVKRLTAAALGWVSFAGALGGFAINQALSASYDRTGSVAGALLAFCAAYAVLGGVNWWHYQRRVFTSAAPSLAEARV